jgi:hypothetical protein
VDCHGMNGAKKSFRRQKAYKEFPTLRLALLLSSKTITLLPKLPRPLNVSYCYDRFNAQ